jgi:hypothetical protein
MRWYVLRTLLHKEVSRQLANRGGVALVLLLVVVTLLLTFAGDHRESVDVLHGGVAHCFVDYWQDDPWVDHLKANVPPELTSRVHFRPVQDVVAEGEELLYPAATAAIQLRSSGPQGKDRRFKVWLWKPAEGNGFVTYEAWFWKESARYFHARLEQAEGVSPSPDGPPAFDQQRSVLTGGFDTRSALATSLVLFALCFACVYLLPSLMCEERERGVLLAQALSPASPAEIMVAKCLFYPLFGVGFAATLVCILNVTALAEPFFWMALLVTACGSMGVGLTIACLARSQRSASMIALGYMLGIALVLYICQQYRVPFIQNFALEFHGPRMLHAVIAGSLQPWHWFNLVAGLVLATCWLAVATVLFRRHGWQ